MNNGKRKAETVNSVLWLKYRNYFLDIPKLFISV